MNKLLPSIFPIVAFLLLNIPVLSQNTIDHWETVVNHDDTWRYRVNNNEPNSNWRNIGFSASNWASGPGGFGYGDGDDNTQISTTTSVYLRKEFSITDATAIEAAILSVDYDDGFIAFFKGVEIARSNVSGNPPPYNQTANNLHEAEMYDGGSPENFAIDHALFVDGANVLAVQVHNESPWSSDLSSNVFLSLGLSSAGNHLRADPILVCSTGSFYIFQPACRSD